MRIYIIYKVNLQFILCIPMIYIVTKYLILNKYLNFKRQKKAISNYIYKQHNNIADVLYNENYIGQFIRLNRYNI